MYNTRKNMDDLKIINANKMFTLISVDKKVDARNTIEVGLNGKPSLPRNFKAEEYRKYKLIVYGLKEEEGFIEKMSKFIGDSIDIEELENKKLDFWSDAYQIGAFEFDSYEEVVIPFGKEDWIAEHQSLIAYFYKQVDKYRKDKVRWRKFMDNLEFFLQKEVFNSEAKNEFLKDKGEVVNKNKKTIDLANRILNLITEYKAAAEES